MIGIKQLVLTQRAHGETTVLQMPNLDAVISLKMFGREPLTSATRSDSDAKPLALSKFSRSVFREKFRPNNGDQSDIWTYEKYAKGLDNREYIVARYSPAGNFQGQFHTNLEAASCAATNSCMSTDYSQIGNTCTGK